MSTADLTQDVTAGAVPAGPVPPGWYPDPAGGHGGRYWDGRGWTRHVTDHGVGGASLDGGTGLAGLRDRVEALGGELDVASGPGGNPIGATTRTSTPAAAASPAV